MKSMKSNEIRKMWIDFFISKQHHFIPPVSLIPVDDPSLLWINSGVATLKPYFDGRRTPPSKRLTNSQKSIRTNDIENVGITARHQTMFEMLGNFSIGDYFKKEAIHFAWELLTSSEWFAIDKEKLYITVFEEDQIAYDIWTKEIGIEASHIFKGTRDTNFWDVGQGPCGPNTEIFFDRGEKWDEKKIGTDLLSKDIENDRYIEIWNIVFSQFNNDGHDNYEELPRKNIDTGAGLERITSIFQDTPTNFETDLFFPIIMELEKMATNGAKYSIENYFKPNFEQTILNTAFKVIADHVRAVTFAIADGVFPGNKERGYIIRRLIRRSSIYGRKLGIEEPFLYKLVNKVVEAMSEFYSYIIPKIDIIKQAIKEEEIKFAKTLSKGLDLLNATINKFKYISGNTALLLFESYGFPIELTIEICNEKNIIVDKQEFYKLLEKNRELSRLSRKNIKAWSKQNELFTKLTVPSIFTGWEEEEHKNSKIVFMFSDGKEVTEVSDGEVFLILDKTPFYAEKGGQAADNGILVNKDGVTFKVIDVQEGPNHQNIHHVILTGTKLSKNDIVDAIVNFEKRFYTMKNHSGTHLLHAALREVLGNSVMQSGSYNDENGLRMDFNFERNITNEKIKLIENVVIREITKAVPREIYFTSMDDAVNKYKALAFFTDKYDDIVRIVRFGEFSCELCGGTHVLNTADIEELMITGIESKGSGIFRVHALTSTQAILNYVTEFFDNKMEIASNVMSKYNKFKEYQINEEIESEYKKIINLDVVKNNMNLLLILLEKLNSSYKLFEKQVKNIIANQKIDKFNNFDVVKNSTGTNMIKLETNLDIIELKLLADKIRNKHNDVLIIITNTEKKLIVVAVGNNLKNISAIKEFNKMPNVKGGGNDTFAQGIII
ncbi:alanine--tRNA ligase [Spiroplasma endosymbiont of Labia minor]|uniref:alanine--tRNA ligase n=1 Tax=Spiroplasma endosymbiont of Labia minor TaxID=3066305 RepID=UPI0030D4763D